MPHCLDKVGRPFEDRSILITIGLIAIGSSITCRRITGAADFCC